MLAFEYMLTFETVFGPGHPKLLYKIVKHDEDATKLCWC